METISGIVAAALVDLRTGSFLDLDSTGRHPKEFVAYLATTTASYFEGDAVRTIATVLDEAAPKKKVERQIDEIIMRSSGFLHVMVRLENDPATVFAVVTSRGAKLGLVLTAVRAIAASAD